MRPKKRRKGQGQCIAEALSKTTVIANHLKNHRFEEERLRRKHRNKDQGRCTVEALSKMSPRQAKVGMKNEGHARCIVEVLSKTIVIAALLKSPHEEEIPPKSRNKDQGPCIVEALSKTTLNHRREARKEVTNEGRGQCIAEPLSTTIVIASLQKSRLEAEMRRKNQH